MDQTAIRRWVLAFSLTLVLHLAILSLFFLRGPSTVAVDDGIATGAIDVVMAGVAPGGKPAPSIAPPAPVPPKPSQSPDTPDIPKVRSVLAIVSDILSAPLKEQAVTPQALEHTGAPATQAAIPGSSGSACDLAGAIQKIMQSDPLTHGALILIPPGKRSAANALMLWNGRWIDADAVGGAPALATIQSAIRKVVLSASPNCRDQLIVGPRFMLVAEPEDTLVLAVGSGTWRWSDLIPPAVGQI